MFQYVDYIYEIYRTGSFSQAARNLYMTQPALSIAVKKEEELIGMPLFDRTVSPVKLTKMGEAYIEGAEQIRELRAQMKRKGEELSGMAGGKLKIGASSFFLSEIVLPALETFGKKYPGVRIEVQEAPSPELKSRLLDESLDLLIDPIERGPEDPFVCRRLFSEYFLLTVPKERVRDRRLLEQALSWEQVKDGAYLSENWPAVSLEKFKEEPFILLGPRSNAYRCALSVCEEHGFKPDVRFYLDQMLTAYRFVGKGLGVSFISDTLIRSEQKTSGILFYKTGSAAAEREVFAVHKKGRLLTAAAEAFITAAEAKIAGLKK